MSCADTLHIPAFGNVQMYVCVCVCVSVSVTYLVWAVMYRFWENHWLWWTAPFIGGLTAGKLYTKFWLPKAQMPAAARKAAEKLL